MQTAPIATLGFRIAAVNQAHRANTAAILAPPTLLDASGGAGDTGAWFFVRRAPIAGVNHRMTALCMTRRASIEASTALASGRS